MIAFFISNLRFIQFYFIVYLGFYILTFKTLVKYSSYVPLQHISR